MKKFEKNYIVKNIRTGEIFLTEIGLKKEIEGVQFIGVWKENDPIKRVVWINKDSIEKIKPQ